MEERPPQPTDAAQWARIERRRTILLRSGIAAGVIIVAAGAWLLFGQAPRAENAATYEPIPSSTEPTEAVTGVATASIDVTAAPGAVATGAARGPKTQPPSPAQCMVAFRRDGKLRVARLDGSGESVVATSAEGVFALSPDTRTIAYVDATSRVLTLVDVASGTHADVGPAALEQPAWPFGSGWCVYTGAAAQSGVRRVSRDGKGARALFSGTSPSVSADGETIAGIRANADGSSAVVIMRGGTATTIAVSGFVTDVALSQTRVVYAVAADDLAAAQVRSMDFSGRGGSVLKSGTQAGARASFQDLCVSGDGNWIAYAEAGDDGYSRLFALDAPDGGTPVPLSVRRDDYPLCWGCDGRLYFIEGNAWQGETTRLMAVRADGTGRTIVVEGASR
ncbi:MAG: hypothetical protein LLG08_06050 [Actinomycetia bacterium]|nr:hypothetical protein [Actinomycetes bacterium]